MQLFNLARESRGEYKTSDWITFSIRTVGIKFTSSVSGGNIYLGQVANASDLNVIRGLYEVRSSNGAIRDDARSITRLEAI